MQMLSFFLAGMAQNKQKALFLLCSLKQNKFQKYKQKKPKEFLLEPSFVME